MSTARKALVPLAWLFVLLVALQFLLAGIGIPTLGGGSIEPHRGLGWMLMLFPVLLLVVSIYAHAPRSSIILTVILVIATGLQPVWAAAFEGETIASLHVLGAAVVLALGHAIAERATQLARGRIA
jgi:hypothetical protein